MVLYSIENPVFARVSGQHHRKIMVLNGVVKMGNGVVFTPQNGGFSIFKRLVTMLQKYEIRQFSSKITSYGVVKTRWCYSMVLSF